MVIYQNGITTAKLVKESFKFSTTLDSYSLSKFQRFFSSLVPIFLLLSCLFE